MVTNRWRIHYIRKVIDIMILSPISWNCHHHKMTNLTLSSTRWFNLNESKGKNISSNATRLASSFANEALRIGEKYVLDRRRLYLKICFHLWISKNRELWNAVKTVLKASEIPKARCKISKAINDKTIEMINTADCLKHVVDQLLAWLRIWSLIGWPIADIFDSSRRIRGWRNTTIRIKKVTWTRDHGK